MELWSVVVAGGTGTRFGRPKQLEPLTDRRVIDHAIDVVRPSSAGIVVVGSAQVGTADSLGVDVVVEGGDTRSASVRRGLVAVPATATHVLIHDAARPLTTQAVVDRVVAALVDGAKAVIPVVPVVDTLRSAAAGTIDRSELVAVQTPQGFDRIALEAAHTEQPDATDDAGVVEAAGVTITHVDGAQDNLKITFPTDLTIAEALLGARSGELEPST